MHGEYKMAGGKLVVADLELEAGCLARVGISGDFFLDPDSALERINTALEGQPGDAGAGSLAQTVAHATTGKIAMYGISPEAIGIAVRRALGDPA